MLCFRPFYQCISNIMLCFRPFYRTQQLIVSRPNNHTNVSHMLPPPAVGEDIYTNMFDRQFLHDVSLTGFEIKPFLNDVILTLAREWSCTMNFDTPICRFTAWELGNIETGDICVHQCTHRAWKLSEHFIHGKVNIFLKIKISSKSIQSVFSHLHLPISSYAIYFWYEYSFELFVDIRNSSF